MELVAQLDDPRSNHCQQQNDAGRRDETRNASLVDDNMVDTQTPSRPTHHMRVYGSTGFTRVRQSLGAWFSQRKDIL